MTREIEAAEENVRAAEEMICRQKRIIASLEREGHTALGAKTMMRLLWDSLRTHEETLTLLRKCNPKSK